jgi:ubiquinone/menaquinone biosynthesis C-methylase UbiE
VEQPKFREVKPYSVLAAGYDVVMEHVEYEAWAEYTHHILHDHHPDPRTILELGCGTGSFSLELQPLGRYQYMGTDWSADMVRVARAKAELEGASIQYEVADFTNFRVDPPVDVVLLLYDGLNYLLEEEQIRLLFDCTYRALKPGGLFFFDQSTPANSIRNEVFFEDEGEAEGFSYVRRSRYDQETRLHTTTFEISVEEHRCLEKHIQRAYELKEIRALIRQSSFEELEAFDGFSTAPATEDSERVHWLLRKPK